MLSHASNTYGFILWPSKYVQTIMNESPSRRSVLALVATSSLAGCSSVLSTSDGGDNDPDCGMLGDGDSEFNLPDDAYAYDVAAQLVTDESPPDSDAEAAYQDVPEDATVVPYVCLEGRDVASLRQVVRAAVDSGGIYGQSETISEAEARRIEALLPHDGESKFVSYDGRVAYVSLGATFGPHQAP